MDPKEFVHLHVHSHFSLLDGACTPKALGKLASKFGMKALALTDHGNMFGAIQFYKAMGDAGVKPILGYEAYVAPGSRKDKQGASGVKDASYHLTLLATNLQGYHNLVKLSSIGYLEGFYYRPRIDLEVLARHKEGIIALSGCNSSEICQHILNNRHADAVAAAARYVDILGKENYYIEVQDNGLSEQRMCLEGLGRVADELGLQLVATNDIHYGKPDDAQAHEVLLCINTGKTMIEEGRMRFGSAEFYFKSGEEMIKRFGHMKNAVENTHAIAERCDIHFEFGRNFPRYVPPDGLTPEQYLRRLAEKGLRDRLGKPDPEHKDRLNYELKVVEQMGYSSYFLIVWDIVHFAREHRIPVGLRGSGNSALLCYVLAISDVDPLKYSLIFERFLDPQRREPPDLDIDICEVRREELIRYLRDKYGHDNTAQIITFGTMKAKAVVKDVARALGWPIPEADALSKRIPATLGATLEGALDQDETLRKDYEETPRIRELIDYGKKLEGLNRHASTHAAGVCIADKPLAELIPICKINDIVMTQFAMGDLEKAGMLKMDLLGLRTLTIVEKTLELIEAKTGKRLDLNAIPFDDPATYELIGRGDTKAVFQLGSTGIQELLRKLKPQNIEDIIAIVALYRPGPLQSGMIDDFVSRRHGETAVQYIDPRLEPILKDTCGVIVYQEQIMRILHDLGDLSLADALSTIKAISKKKSEEIEKRSEAFFKGAEKKKLKPDAAQALFELIRKFAQYGFNRSHTTPYAFLAYRTAWLKAHYPMEFAAADLTCEMNHSDKLKEHVRDCTQLGIKIVPPCINQGAGHFTVCDEKSIRFGMMAVRSVGDKAVEAILQAREKGGPFASLHDFCERVEAGALNRQAVDSLIKAGAFDTVPGNRAQKIAALEDALRMGQRAQQDRRRGQKSLFGGGGSAGAKTEKLPDQPLPPVKEWPPAELGRHEKEAIGLRLSFNPLDRYAPIIQGLATTVADLKNKLGAEPVIMAGEIMGVRPIITKHGRAMAQIELEDLTGSIRCVIFPEAYDKCASLLKEDGVVFVIGTPDRSSERPGLQIQEVIPIVEGAAKLTQSVKLRLPHAALETPLLDGLQAVCQRHRGDRPVLLEIATPDQKRVLIKAGREFAVQPTEEFLADARKILGEEGVQLIPRKPTIDPNGSGRRFGNGGRRPGANGG